MLFLFFTLLINSVKAQCPPSISSTTITNASSVSVNDGQAVAQVIAGIGPFTYYWENLSTSNPAYGPTITMISTDTFANAPSGTYTISIIDAGCPATFLIDTITITGSGGSFSYSKPGRVCSFV